MTDRELIKRLLFLAQTAVDQALDLNYDDPEDYFIYRELRELKAAALAQPEPQGPDLTACDLLERFIDCFWDEQDAESYPNAAALVAQARALLAQPEPEGPTDEELKAAYWEAFKNAAPCGADQSWLAGLRAVALWDRCVIEPDGPAVLGSREPASVTDQPTDKELWELYDEIGGAPEDSAWCANYARAALARWGRPAIEPVPVSDPPGPDDCDVMGRCWWFAPPAWGPRTIRPCWTFDSETLQGDTHWLPHWALPVPGVEAADG